MAVHGKDSLVKLLRRFLATTINPAETSEGEVKDKEAFENIKQIVSLALLADTGSIYGILKIVAESYRTALQEHVNDIDSLLTIEGLLGIGLNSSNRVDVSKLRQASSKIKELTAENSSLAMQASATLESFLRNEMLSLSVEGNTNRSITNIKDFEKKISLAWQNIVDKKTATYKVVENFNKDTLVASALEKAVDIMSSDINLAAELLSSGTEEDFANISRAIELLTAGTKAFLDFMFEDNNFLGTTIVEPDLGYTPFVPDVFAGNGTLTPPVYVARGEKHRPFIDYIIGSNNGYMLNLITDEKKAHVSTKQYPFNIASSVDTVTNTGSIYLMIDGTTEVSITLTTAEILDTGNWANPYSVSDSEMLTFLQTKIASHSAHIALYGMSGVIRFSTVSANKSNSTIEVLGNSYAPFLAALGLLANSKTRGKSVSKKFQDTNIVSASASWDDSPVNLRIDGREAYHLLAKESSTVQNITNVDADNLYIDVSPGIEESLSNIAYIISVEKPGKLIQPAKREGNSIVQDAVRKPPSATSHLGDALDGGFIRHKGKTGKIQTTVIALPNYDESLSVPKGDTWNGYGSHGFWKPVVKSRGIIKHCRVSGSTGIPGPLKAYGENGITRKSLYVSGSNYGTLGEAGPYIYNAMLDFQHPSGNQASHLEMKNVYYRESQAPTHQSGAPAYGPQIYDVKTGDYLLVVNQDDDAATTPNAYSLNQALYYAGGVINSNSLYSKGHRIREIRNWYISHIHSSFEILPTIDLPASLQNNDSFLGSHFDFDPSLNIELSIDTRIIYAHRFKDSTADFLSRGIAPGDILIIYGYQYDGTQWKPNDSADASIVDLGEIIDRSQVKAFEVAQVVDNETIYLNTGWVEGNADLSTNGTTFTSPYYVRGLNLSIPIPAMVSVTSFPYPGGTNEYVNLSYEILRRGSVNTGTEESNSSALEGGTGEHIGGLSVSHKVSYIDGDYYKFGIPEVDTGHSFGPGIIYWNETYDSDTTTGTLPTFAQAGIVKGDILNIISTNYTGPLSASIRTLRDTSLTSQYKVYYAGEDSLQVYKAPRDGSTGVYVDEYSTKIGVTTVQQIQGFDWYSENVTFKVYEENYHKVFYCRDVDFISNGVVPGMTLRITNTSFSGDYTIESVRDSNTVLIQANTPSLDSDTDGFRHASGAGEVSNASFLVTLASNTIYDPEATFQSDGIIEDDILVFRNNSGAFTEHLVSSVTDQNTLVLKTVLPETDFTTDRYYLIKQKADSDGAERTTQFCVNTSAGNFSTGGSSGGFDDLPDFPTMKMLPINLSDPALASNYEVDVTEVLLRTQDPSEATDFLESRVLFKGGQGYDTTGRHAATTNDHLKVMEVKITDTLFSGHPISVVGYTFDVDGLKITQGADDSANLNWVLLMGKESPFFEDTVNTFSSSMEGERLTINPGVIEYSSHSPYSVDNGKELQAEVTDVIDSNVLVLNKRYPVETSDGRPMTGYWTGPATGVYGEETYSAGNIVLWLKPETLAPVTNTVTTYTENSGDAALYMPVRGNENLGFGTTSITSYAGSTNTTEAHWRPISCSFNVRLPLTSPNSYTADSVIFSLVDTTLFTWFGSGQGATIAVLDMTETTVRFRFRRLDNGSGSIGPLSNHITWTVSALNDDSWKTIHFRWTGNPTLDSSSQYVLEINGQVQTNSTVSYHSLSTGNLAGYDGLTIFGNDLRDTTALHLSRSFFSNLVIYVNNSGNAPAYYPRQLGSTGNTTSNFYFPLRSLDFENRFNTEDLFIHDRTGTNHLSNTHIKTEYHEFPTDGASRGGSAQSGDFYYHGTGTDKIFGLIGNPNISALPTGGSRGHLFAGNRGTTATESRFYLKATNNFIQEGSAVSFVFYINPSNSSGTFSVISANDSGGTPRFWVAQIGTSWYINTLTASGQNTLTFGGSVSTSAWHQIVITWDGTTANLDSHAKFYLNGNEVTPTSTTIADTTNTLPSVQDFYFFAQDNAGTQQCNAIRIYKVFVYNSVLSASDVLDKYNSGTYSNAKYADSANDYHFVDDSKTHNARVLGETSIMLYTGQNTSQRVLQLNYHFGWSNANSSRFNALGSLNWNDSSLNSQPDTTQATTNTFLNVENWADSSGNSNNATQTVQANAPIYNANDLNSYHTATFDGLDDFMTISDSNTLDLNPSYGATFFAVINLSGYAADGTLAKILSKGDTSSQYQFGVITNINTQTGTVQGMSYVSPNGNTDSDDSSAPLSTWLIVAATTGDSGTTGPWRVNGTPNATNSSVQLGLSNSSPLTLGALTSGLEGFSGKIAEIILINDVLTNSEIEDTEGYLAHKYNLSLSLPVAHPYQASEPVFVGELFGGKDKLMYLHLPKDYPQPGMEFLVGGSRYPIEEVLFASNKGFTPPPIASETAPTISMTSYTPALRLSKALSIKQLSEDPYFIVRPGGDPFVTNFVAQTVKDNLGDAVNKGFQSVEKTTLVGKKLTFDSGQTTTIKNVLSETELVTDSVFKFIPANTLFKITLETAANILKFYTIRTPSGTPLADDYLSVWTVNTPSVVSEFVAGSGVGSDSSHYKVKAPGVTSGLTDVYYTVSRGGDPNFGHYVLLKYFLDKVKFSNTFLNSTMLLYEAIDKKGIDFSSVVSSLSGSNTGTTAVGVTLNDGEKDSLQLSFEKSYALNGAQSDLSSCSVGDRVKLVYYNTSTLKHYTIYTFIKTVNQSENGNFSCSLYKKVQRTDTSNLIVNWEVETGSVPRAIKEVQSLKNTFNFLITIIDQYQPQTTGAITSALDLLQEQGMDRAIDLLKEGNLTEFLNMDYREASYSAKLTKDIQELGGSI